MLAKCKITPNLPMKKLPIHQSPTVRKNPYLFDEIYWHPHGVVLIFDIRTTDIQLFYCFH